MEELRYTLVAEGPSDDALIPILTWLLGQNVRCPIVPAFARLSGVYGLSKKAHDQIVGAAELYPCDVLFIHRDADARDALQTRREQLKHAVEIAGKSGPLPPVVPVVPVQEMETWLLIDEVAIRHVSGRPKSKDHLNLPKLNALERLARPKERLADLLRRASGKTGRDLEEIRGYGCARRVVDAIKDFQPLRQLPAFSMLEQDVLNLIEEKGWNT